MAKKNYINSYMLSLALMAILNADFNNFKE